MSRPSSFIPHAPGGRAAFQKNDAKGVTDHLRTHNVLSSILPAVSRLVTLQQDCRHALPGLFDACQVMNLAEGELTIAIPNAAFAAKLKQRVPKLLDYLIKRGWQVSAIRLKVQVVQKLERPVQTHSARLTASAVEAFEELAQSLEPNRRNASLLDALHAMLARRQHPETR